MEDPKDNTVEIPSFQVNPNNTPLSVVVVPSPSVNSPRTSSYISDASQPATFQEIINDVRSTPFSREDLRSFLRKRMIEETLDFCINLIAFEDRFKNKKELAKLDKEAGVALRVLNDPSNSSLPEDKLMVLTANAIVDEFVADGAPKEINISGKLRNEISSTVRSWKSDDKGANASVFDSVYGEALILLETNSYAEFLKLASSMNISALESKARLKNAFMRIFIVLLFIGVLIALEATLRAPIHFIRLLAYFPLHKAFKYFESSRRRVCLVCEELKVTGSYDDSLMIEDGQKEGKLKPMTDPYALKSMHSQAEKLKRFAFIEAVLLVGIIMAIPPYNTFY